MLMHSSKLYGVYKRSAHQTTALLSEIILSLVRAACMLRSASYGSKHVSQSLSYMPFCAYLHTQRQIGTETERQRQRQTDRQTDRQIERHTHTRHAVTCSISTWNHSWKKWTKSNSTQTHIQAKRKLNSKWQQNSSEVNATSSEYRSCEDHDKAIHNLLDIRCLFQSSLNKTIVPQILSPRLQILVNRSGCLS